MSGDFWSAADRGFGIGTAWRHNGMTAEMIGFKINQEDKGAGVRKYE